MTINIYKSNDGKPPYKIIGGNAFYIYSDEVKKFFVYSNSNEISIFNCECKNIIITYQPDEVLVYEKWDNSKDRYGNKVGEYEPF